MHMPVRSVVATVDLHRADLFDPSKGCINHDHRMSLVLWRIGITRADHDNIDGTARIARTRRPPFFAIQHIVITVTNTCHRNIGSVRTSDIRLGHQIRGSDQTIHQRGQPAGLHRVSAITLEHLHIAGVRRIAIEHLSSDMHAAHFFGQMGVINSRQPRPFFAVRQPKVPQTSGLGAGL